MIEFTLNGRAAEAPSGLNLLSFIRGEAGLTGAKNACGEGSCGACSVLVDGAIFSACVLPIERVAGKSVVTIEGIPAAEMEAYTRAFAECGAVQCGYCTPGMIISAKALLDKKASPTEAEVRAAIRRNLCRCTGYARIVEAVLRAADYRAGRRLPPSADAQTAASSVGGSLLRVDALKKARGEAKYVDDLVAPGMLLGAVLRTPHPRAKLLCLDVSAARSLEGVVAVATWEDIPGERFIGHLVPDWPTLVAVGETTRYVGDAIALVAAETGEIARAALALIRADYEILEPLRSPEAALAPGAPSLHPRGNVLSRLTLDRGDAARAIAGAAHRIERSYSTGFNDHAFLEPESALAFPPDAEGLVLVRTGEQNVYDGRRYVAATLGLEETKVRVQSAYVGGGFGGKEDQSVQHHAALLAWLARRPVKLTLARAESSRVHVKRHAMKVDLSLGCDEAGRILGVVATIVADTGAYASLGSPVLHRAVTHLGGPYSYDNIHVEGMAVHTNNPPAGAFRGFGVPQVNFAFESALNELAAMAGISPWEIRFRNAIRPGALLPNGQIAGPDTALEECLLAVRSAFDSAPGRVGLACGFKNTGIGMGHADTGRCDLVIGENGVELRTGAACVGQGLATILTQIACEVLSISSEYVEVALPDTATTPDSGTSTASRQTLLTGEAARRACAAAKEALVALGSSTPSASEHLAAKETPSFPYSALAGRVFSGEFEAVTDPFDSAKANPIRHVAYSYACHLAILGADNRLERIVAAHDSGLVVNPLAFKGQVEGGVAMGLGYALSEDFPLVDCVPTAKFGQLGLLRSSDVPPIETIIIRRVGAGTAMDGGTSASAFGAKGIGEISAIPTAAAVAAAYAAKDGEWRKSLPLVGTPYRKG